MSISVCVYVKVICFLLNVKLRTGCNPCRYRGGHPRSTAYCWAKTLVGVHHLQVLRFDYVNVNVQFLYMYM